MANAFQSLEARRQGKLIGLTGLEGACSKEGTVELPGFPREVAARVVRENAYPGRGSGVLTGLNFNPPRLFVGTLAHTHLLTCLSPSPASSASSVACSSQRGRNLQLDLASFPFIPAAYP